MNTKHFVYNRGTDCNPEAKSNESPDFVTESFIDWHTDH